MPGLHGPMKRRIDREVERRVAPHNVPEPFFEVSRTVLTCGDPVCEDS
jgi:hypothetical protein